MTDNLTVVGRLTRDGAYDRGAGFDARHRYGTARPEQYLTFQGRLPVLFEHDTDLEIGEVVWLERSRAAGMMVVATVIDSPLLAGGGDWFLSDRAQSYTCARGGESEDRAIRMTEISIVGNPAFRGQHPVRFTNLDLAESSADGIRGLPVAWYDTCARAHAVLSRRRPADLEIVDVDLDDLVARSRNTPLEVAIGHADRRIAELADVPTTSTRTAPAHVRSFPAGLEMSEGQLFGRLVPYDRAARVADRRPDGTWDQYSEGFRRGAFAEQVGTGEGVAGVELRHQHSERGLGFLGPATSLAEQPDGLHGEFKIVASKRADVADLLAAGVTGLSIEFRERPGGTTETAGVRWRTAVHLQACALEARGAYADAGVTGYRGGDVA